MDKVLGEKLHKRYLQLGKSFLRLSEPDAVELANVVFETRSVLEGFTMFCIGPTAHSAELNSALLRRWLLVVPRFLTIAPFLAKKPIDPAPVKSLGEELLCHIEAEATVVGRNYWHMSERTAQEFGNCIRRSASVCFAFHQKCLAPDKFTLKEHAALLNAFANEALCHALGAHKLMVEGTMSNHG